jgi:glutaredoxin
MNTQLSKKENTILFIYSDYCMYCIAMKDAWTKIKKKYKSKRIVEVEINNIYDLNENIRREVIGVPIIFTINNSKIMDRYNGDRSFKDMDKYIKRVLKKRNNTKKRNTKKRITKKRITKKK